MRNSLICVLLALLLSLTSQAATTLRDMVFMPISPVTSYSYSHGYAENRIRITNQSTERRVVRLVAPARTYSYNNGGIEHLERTVIINPRTSIEVTLPCPSVSLAGNNKVNVFVHGVKWGTVPLPSKSSSPYYNSISCLTSRTVDAQALRDSADKTIRSMKVGYPGGTRKFYRSELEFPNWSRSWRAYSSYDSVILQNRDISSIPPDLSETLRQYVAAGGTLTVLGSTKLPFGWMAPLIKGNNAYHQFSLGFGSVILISSGDPKKIDAKTLSQFVRTVKQTLNPWLQKSKVSLANKKLPVTNKVTLPVRGMFLIMLSFSIFIGPVTLIILARKNRRIWFLWIAPLFSFVVCAIIATYSVLSEGVTPTVAGTSITLLNQGTHQSVTLGVLGIYCPLTPSGGLHFDRHAEITILTRDSSSSSRKSINWTKDQNLSRGWASARVPAFFMIRKAETRRERLEIISKSGKRQVINGLGATIKQLWLRDSSGKWFTIDKPLASGKKAKLTNIDNIRQTSKYKNSLRDIYIADNWIDKFKEIPESRGSLLLPEMYLAVLDGGSFVSHGVRGKVHKKHTSYVIGSIPHVGDL